VGTVAAMDDMTSQSRAGSSRGLLLIAGVVLLLLAATVAVVLLAGGPREPDLEPGSPEAALHGYLTAFDEGDLETAHSYFSASLRQRWSLDAYRRAVDLQGTGHHPDGGPARRVVFDRSDVFDDTARVRLTVEEFYGEGLGGSTYRSAREVRMVREEGAWYLDQALVGLEPVWTDVR
jgi:hypothetical protein